MKLLARTTTLPLRRTFSISHGALDAVDVVRVRIEQDGQAGYGEARPYARYGESTASVLKQIAEVELSGGEGNPAELLPPGAAKAAVDAAWRDWQVRSTGKSVEKAQAPDSDRPAECATARTIAIGTARDMHAAAQDMARSPLLKVKLDAQDVEARLRAVRAGAPEAQLIVDANEAWSADILRALAPVLAETRISLLEQPLPADADGGLADMDLPMLVCADESCHTARDIERLKSRYDAVNVKLDKAGGLGAARDLIQAAQAAGLQVMLGCMVSSSLSIAPASFLAGLADFVDLDGPDWLARDIQGGFQFRNGFIRMAGVNFWGTGHAPSPDVTETFA